jgi:hypothetical protein
VTTSELSGSKSTLLGKSLLNCVQLVYLQHLNYSEAEAETDQGCS